MENHSRQNLVQCPETTDIHVCASIYIFDAEQTPVQQLLDTARTGLAAGNGDCM